MRPTVRLLTSLFAALALLLGAAGCGDEDPVTAEPDTPAEQPAIGNIEPGDDEIPVAGCYQLEERPDGVYSAGDAGAVELRTSGDGVELVEAMPVEGWTVEDRTQEEGAIEVTFSEDEREIHVDARVVEGELLVDVCES